MNATQEPGHETQNAEAQTALTEAALEKVNEGNENPSQHTHAGSVISGLIIDQNWDVGSAVGTERVSSTDSVRPVSVTMWRRMVDGTTSTRRANTTFQTIKTSRIDLIYSIIYSY